MGFSWTLGYTGFVGVIAFGALIIGGSYILKRFLKLNFIPSIPFVTPQLAGILALVLVVMVALPFVAPKTAKSIGGGDGVSVAPSVPVTSAVSCNRPTGGNTASYLFAIENVDNPADAYLASSVNVVKNDGVIDQTGNAVAGSTLSYVTLSVTPCETGKIYVLGNSTQIVDYSSNQPQTSKTVDGSLSTALNINVLNFNTGASILANGSIPSSGVCPTETTAAATCGQTATSGGGNANTSVIVANQTLGSGGSVNFKYTLVAITANSRFGAFTEAGSNGEGAIISAYISNLARISATGGVKLGGLDGGANVREITCPSDISANRRANKCWVVNSLKSGFTYTGSGTITCDLGDCAPQDYVDLFVDDLQWVKDTDNKFKKVAFLLDGTNIIAGGTGARFLLN